MTKQQKVTHFADSAVSSDAQRIAREIRKDMEIAAQRSCAIANRAEWRIRLYEFISKTMEF